jgi:DUF2933 family protein
MLPANEPLIFQSSGSLTLVSVLPFQREIPMEPTQQLTTIPAAAGRSSCSGTSHGSGNWPGRRRGLVLGGAVIMAATALALTRHWITVAELAPLLFLLPCAVMMFMCMKGMNHSQQTSAAPAPTSADTSTSN